MNAPDRILLADVPRVHFYEGGEQSPEDVPFPSCLAACLRYMGEEYPWLTGQEHGRAWRDNWANIYILAHSGMAFGLRWREGWHMDNADHMMANDPNEIIRRAFAAVGYTYEIVHQRGTPEDEMIYRQRIEAALAAGRPVLAFGVVGPPECCLITGYDESGDVIMGWNFFQGLPPWNAGLEFEPTGQFRKRNWFAETWSLIVVGEKTGRPKAGPLNRETLRWALTVARTPKVYDHHTGHAAYTAWANQLADDAAFAGKNEAALREQHEAHNNVVGMLAECRWYASRWLRTIAPDEPAMAPALLAAAACFEQEHALMWKVWGAVGGNGHPDAWAALARPEVRRQVVELILQAREQDVEAAAHLERALEA
jgi:hypothetical protein